MRSVSHGSMLRQGIVHVVSAVRPDSNQALGLAISVKCDILHVHAEAALLGVGTCTYLPFKRRQPALLEMLADEGKVSWISNCAPEASLALEGLIALQLPFSHTRCDRVIHKHLLQTLRWLMLW